MSGANDEEVRTNITISLNIGGQMKKLMNEMMMEVKKRWLVFLYDIREPFRKLYFKAVIKWQK